MAHCDSKRLLPVQVTGKRNCRQCSDSRSDQRERAERSVPANSSSSYYSSDLANSSAVCKVTAAALDTRPHSATRSTVMAWAYSQGGGRDADNFSGDLAGSSLGRLNGWRLCGEQELASSLQAVASVRSSDISLLTSDDIPTRDAGLDLSFTNNARKSLRGQKEPHISSQAGDRSHNNLVAWSLSRSSEDSSDTLPKGKPWVAKRRRRRRRGVEASQNNNSLNHRRTLMKFERGNLSSNYSEDRNGELTSHEAQHCADIPAGPRRPSTWVIHDPFELDVTPHNVDNLLISARFFNQGDVIRLCKDALVSCDVETALYYRFVAEKHELVDILPYLLDFVRKNFSAIVCTHSFLGMALPQVQELLEDDGLNVMSELEVFDAARAWIDHCKHERIKVAMEVMRCVRFINIPPEDVVKYVEPHAAYFRGQGGREVLLSLYRFHALHGLTDVNQELVGINITRPPRHYWPLGLPAPTHALDNSTMQQDSRKIELQIYKQGLHQELSTQSLLLAHQQKQLNEQSARASALTEHHQQQQKQTSHVSVFTQEQHKQTTQTSVFTEQLLQQSMGVNSVLPNAPEDREKKHKSFGDQFYKTGESRQKNNSHGRTTGESTSRSSRGSHEEELLQTRKFNSAIEELSGIKTSAQKGQLLPIPSPETIPMQDDQQESGGKSVCYQQIHQHSRDYQTSVQDQKSDQLTQKGYLSQSSYTSNSQCSQTSHLTENKKPSKTSRSIRYEQYSQPSQVIEKEGSQTIQVKLTEQQSPNHLLGKNQQKQDDQLILSEPCTRSSRRLLTTKDNSQRGYEHATQSSQVRQVSADVASIKTEQHCRHSDPTLQTEYGEECQKKKQDTATQSSGCQDITKATPAKQASKNRHKNDQQSIQHDKKHGKTSAGENTGGSFVLQKEVKVKQGSVQHVVEHDFSVTAEKHSSDPNVQQTKIKGRSYHEEDHNFYEATTEQYSQLADNLNSYNASKQQGMPLAECQQMSPVSQGRTSLSLDLTTDYSSAGGSSKVYGSPTAASTKEQNFYKLQISNNSGKTDEKYLSQEEVAQQEGTQIGPVKSDNKQDLVILKRQDVYENKEVSRAKRNVMINHGTMYDAPTVSDVSVQVSSTVLADVQHSSPFPSASKEKQSHHQIRNEHKLQTVKRPHFREDQEAPTDSEQRKTKYEQRPCVAVHSGGFSCPSVEDGEVLEECGTGNIRIFIKSPSSCESTCAVCPKRRVEVTQRCLEQSDHAVPQDRRSPRSCFCHECGFAQQLCHCLVENYGGEKTSSAVFCSMCSLAQPFCCCDAVRQDGGTELICPDCDELTTRCTCRPKCWTSKFSDCTVCGQKSVNCRCRDKRKQIKGSSFPECCAACGQLPCHCQGKDSGQVKTSSRCCQQCSKARSQCRCQQATDRPLKMISNGIRENVSYCHHCGEISSRCSCQISRNNNECIKIGRESHDKLLEDTLKQQVCKVIQNGEAACFCQSCREKKSHYPCDRVEENFQPSSRGLTSGTHDQLCNSSNAHITGSSTSSFTYCSPLQSVSCEFGHLSPHRQMAGYTAVNEPRDFNTSRSPHRKRVNMGQTRRSITQQDRENGCTCLSEPSSLSGAGDCFNSANLTQDWIEELEYQQKQLEKLRVELSQELQLERHHLKAQLQQNRAHKKGERQQKLKLLQRHQQQLQAEIYKKQQQHLQLETDALPQHDYDLQPDSNYLQHQSHEQGRQPFKQYQFNQESNAVSKQDHKMYSSQCTLQHGKNAIYPQDQKLYRQHNEEYNVQHAENSSYLRANEEYRQKNMQYHTQQENTTINQENHELNSHLDKQYHILQDNSTLCQLDHKLSSQQENRYSQQEKQYSQQENQYSQQEKQYSQQEKQYYAKQKNTALLPQDCELYSQPVKQYQNETYASHAQYLGCSSQPKKQYHHKTFASHAQSLPKTPDGNAKSKLQTSLNAELQTEGHKKQEPEVNLHIVNKQHEKVMKHQPRETVPHQKTKTGLSKRLIQVSPPSPRRSVFASFRPSQGPVSNPLQVKNVPSWQSKSANSESQIRHLDRHQKTCEKRISAFNNNNSPQQQEKIRESLKLNDSNPTNPPDAQIKGNSMKQTLKSAADKSTAVNDGQQINQSTLSASMDHSLRNENKVQRKKIDLQKSDRCIGSKQLVDQLDSQPGKLCDENDVPGCVDDCRYFRGEVQAVTHQNNSQHRRGITCECHQDRENRYKQQEKMENKPTKQQDQQLIRGKMAAQTLSGDNSQRTKIASSVIGQGQQRQANMYSRFQMNTLRAIQLNQQGNNLVGCGSVGKPSIWSSENCYKEKQLRARMLSTSGVPTSAHLSQNDNAPFDDPHFHNFMENTDDLCYEPIRVTLHYRDHPYKNHGRHLLNDLQTEDVLLLAVGGIDPKQMDADVPAGLIQCYNIQSGQWSVLTKLPDPRHHHGCVLMDGYLYVIGGSVVAKDDLYNMTHATNTCFRYNFGSQSWTQIASMRCPRMYHACAVLHGVIYAVGGETQEQEEKKLSFLDSGEFYNADTDEWGPIANMMDGLIGATAVGYKGLLWLIGGYLGLGNENVVFASVECYNPRTNSWIMRRPLPRPICHASAVVVGDCLLLVGGSYIKAVGEPVTSVDTVLQYLEEADTWVEFATMSSPRHDAGVCVVDTQVFILGGVCSLNKDAVDTVECLECTTEEWKVYPHLPQPSMGLSALTLTLRHFNDD